MLPEGKCRYIDGQIYPDGNFYVLDTEHIKHNGNELKSALNTIVADVSNKVDKVSGKGLSTEDYTTAEKNKLSGIADDANNYVHPTTSGNKHIPSGGSSGKILGWSADGEAAWVDPSGGGGGGGSVETVFIDSTEYAPDANGKVTLPAYPTSLPASDVYSWAKASTKPSYTASEVGAASDSHTHGNITNDGKLQTTDVSIANGDKLVITDSSNSSKVARASVSFDGSTTTQFLSKKGTWETPSGGSVTGVKGSNESSYRTGNVSLSYSNVGAAPSSHSHSDYVKQAYYTSNKTSGSLNDLSEGRVYCSSNCTNLPVSANMMVETLVDYNGSYKTQRAEVISGSYAGHVFSRYYNGSWSPWIDLTLNAPISLPTSGNISSASIDLSSILTGTYLFTVTNNESGTNRYGCSVYILQKFDSGTIYVLTPVSEKTLAKISSFSFSGNTMSLSFDKSGYKTLRLICLYR